MEFEEKVVLLVLLHKEFKKKKRKHKSGYIPYSIQDRNVACFTRPLKA
jgi:hypothetical protein